MKYIYFSIYKFYHLIIKEVDSDVYSIGFISMIQYLYLECFISIYGMFIGTVIPFQIEKIFIAIIIIFGVNFFYFNNVNISDEKIEKWENESVLIRLIKSIFVVVFIVFAPILLYSLVVYRDFFLKIIESVH